MGALNTYCHGTKFSDETALKIEKTVEGTPTDIQVERPGKEEEIFSLAFIDLLDSEAAAINAIQEAVGFSGVIAWTPPDEGSDRMFRFVRDSYEQTSTAADNHEIKFQLRHAPGIPVP